ncbi:MAG: FdhF/YdeP family oxidoreductase [Planctomycetota bacterium]|nr:FdhF/YdeP family oxidoreductase [Planctomycetota bacterium]
MAKHAGGWHAVWYALKKSRQAGGFLKMFRALRSRNACKTCALGMGGQRGGMVNETGGFPEVCKKSLQAMAADMQGGIREDFWRKNSLAALKKMTPRELEMSGRLVQPLLYESGSKHLRPIDWEEAISRIASRLQGIQPDQTFWYFSGRSSNEAGFSLQLLARLYGTNNVNNCSYYCHQASGVGLSSAIGSGTATVVLEDLEHADLVFLIGGNPPSNHPRLMTSLMRIKRRGGKVIVINPVVETGLVKFKIPSNVRSMLLGTRVADLYVQPHIGGDLALLTGVAKEIDHRGASDRQFLEDHCDDVEAWLQSIRSTSWEDIQNRSGVSREEIVQIADLYQQSEKTIMGWTMGITHHQHGVQNVQAIANLALMRGMVGRPHAGLMPIRGHSNVQGIGSVGVTPRLKDAFFSALQDHYQVQLPTSEGKDTLACIEAAHRGELKMGFCLGGNLYGSNPDSVFAAEAMQQLDGLVHLSTTLNTGHLHGLAGETIILPVLARDEEPQPTTQESMFNYVRLSDGGPRRHVGPRGEVEVIAEIASRVLGEQGPVDWGSMKNTSSIRHAIGQVVPGFEAIGTIDQSRKEFQIGGRTFHQPRFATKNGRARLHAHLLPELQGAENELRLMTVRSEGQFNTVVYEEEDYYRGQDRRDVILVHPDDLARLGLEHDQLVRVQSETGQLDHIYLRSFDSIRQGNALMYFPEANVLVSRAADAQSRTPAFKGVVVRIEPMGAVER